MRAMRKFFNPGLLVLGIVVILTASLLVEEIRIRSLIILVGILLIQASMRLFAEKVMPKLSRLPVAS